MTARGPVMARSSVRSEAFMVDGGRILRWGKDGEEAARRSNEATLTSDRVYRWLTPSRSAFPTLPTVLALGRCLCHEEPGPGKFVSPRSQGRSYFFGQRFWPVREVAEENEST